MRKNAAVIGLGIFGRRAALSLTDRGISVLAIDRVHMVVEEIKDQVDQALILDSTDETALREAGIDRMEMAICAIGNQHVEDCILTTALLSKLGVKRILARAGNPLQEKILFQVGAHEVINPEEAMAERAAFRLAQPELKEIILMGGDISVAETAVPKKFIGKSLKELDVRNRYNITVIGIKRPKKSAPEKAEEETNLILNIAPDQRFEAGDHLIVLAREEDLTVLPNI